jgi:hypothetical protein
MIDQDELKICRKRGHTVRPSEQGWMQCTACGMWLRETRTIEERESEPPEDELDPSVQTRRHLESMDALQNKKIENSQMN